MVVYECGNWGDDDECKLCGADVRETQTAPLETVVIECEGWYEDD